MNFLIRCARVRRKNAFFGETETHDNDRIFHLKVEKNNICKSLSKIGVLTHTAVNVAPSLATRSRSVSVDYVDVT